ncbi:MAG TPA: flagellar hook protein FlgE [Anaerolineales bacterium]|nr:flagellar hook protein FlgE [Anaerolineales bacterium]
MIRSMFTAISSLNLHQKYLDVVSNNLANANTNGYKSSRVLFQDQFSQTLGLGSAPTDTTGGTNPTQIGLGARLGYISPNFTQGTLQGTGRNMDLSVQGDGFFVYGQDAGRRYSREGAMDVDADGYLVNIATGLRTQGWLAGANGIDANLPVDDIQIDTDKTAARATENVLFGGNLSAATATDGTGTVSVSMGVYDSLGALTTASVKFTRTAADPLTWNWEIVDPATGLPNAATGVGNGTITFDADGQVDTTVTPNPVVTTPVEVPGSDGSANGGQIALTLDFSKMTMLTTGNSATVTSQDGLAAGTISDVYISPNDGVVSLVYSNGMTEQVGQVALARFTNPAGLARAEGTAFIPGLNSGDPQIGTAATGGRGGIATSYLEASNVDMAQEFTNMILAQRGFQASSRVITTSDEILQELVNLKR